MEKEIREKIAPFNDIPIVFISVKEKQRIFRAIEEGVGVFENRTRKIRTSDLNELMQEKIEKVPPPTYRGSYVKIKYVTQLPIHYPAFAFFCNNPKHLRESYKNYLENQLRENYDFSGVPITIHFRKK